jgi:hypothetical protein
MCIYCMEKSPSWRTDSRSSSQVISRPFMGPEVSLLYSQEPATHPYLEPDEATP